MSRAIAFTAVDVSDEGVITCAVHRHGEAQELWFRLPYAFTPAPDLLAAVFAGLCGAVFDEVQIDLPIGPRLSAAIEEMTRARVEHASGTDRSREPGSSCRRPISSPWTSADGSPGSAPCTRASPRTS